ncbi:MAG: SagB/ThcOx family dehydrogenase, partial [Candidatus Acidiferrales bacterium]
CTPLPLPKPTHDLPLGVVARRRRSALDFDPRTPPMERIEVVQLLDFATRDWRTDWRGNFHGPATEYERGADFVTLYLYVHRVSGCQPGVYRWCRSSRMLEQLYRGNVERLAAFLSLEQTLAGNSCFTVSMIADLTRAAQALGNRGYRCVYFEAGAIGQRLYLGAEALNWNATGIGAFYDDDVHRYLGFLEEGDSPVNASLQAAEQEALVMSNSPASRHTGAHDLIPPEPASKDRVNEVEAAPHKDPRTLPQQVIYHFAVGRAVPDTRIEA